MSRLKYYQSTVHVSCPPSAATSCLQRTLQFSTQLSMKLSIKLQLLIKTKMPENKDFSSFQTLRCCIYHADECLNANPCWHFNVYVHDQFHA